MSDDIVSDFFSNKVEKQPIVSEETEYSEYEVTPCYAKRRDKRFELMLDIQFVGDKRLGLSYSYLRGAAIDGAELIFYFTSHKIIVSGKNLMPIYEAVLEHRLHLVQEEGERFEPLAEKRTFIAKIDVLPPD